MGFSRQEYCSGLLCPSLGGLPDPGIEPRSPALQVVSLLWVTRKALWRHIIGKNLPKLNRIPYLGGSEMAILGLALGEGWLPLAFEVYSVHQHHHSRWAYGTFMKDIPDFAFWKINWEKNANFKKLKTRWIFFLSYNLNAHISNNLWPITLSSTFHVQCFMCNIWFNSHKIPVGKALSLFLLPVEKSRA